jgi:hypothetical protein
MAGLRDEARQETSRAVAELRSSAGRTDAYLPPLAVALKLSARPRKMLARGCVAPTLCEMATCTNTTRHIRDWRFCAGRTSMAEKLDRQPTIFFRDLKVLAIHHAANQNRYFFVIYLLVSHVFAI